MRIVRRIFGLTRGLSRSVFRRRAWIKQTCPQPGERRTEARKLLVNVDFKVGHRAELIDSLAERPEDLRIVVVAIQRNDHVGNRGN